MIKNIFSGIFSYRNALQLINRLGLWRYFAIPIAISLVTAIAIGLLAWWLSGILGDLISIVWVWEWGASTFNAISDFLGAIIIITLGVVLYKHIVMALSAPFMSPVSEKIEAHLYGFSRTETREHSFMTQLWRGIRINARNLGMELILTLPILLLSLIPIVNFITGFALFLVQSYYAGFGNMDYTLERHMNASHSIRFVRSHSGIAVGNGIVFMLMLLIPVIGIILVFPLSVTAASTETLRLLHDKPAKQTAIKSTS
ncbi:EI24 domain-containing protein [Altibacter sp. HG106]|uniref:EI24 domain-containing protein n=1 Tax=Altibacter sp. HG106 TaxID=3023937 RepID=UPI002350DEAF|nr:EI24 domain-containing protein [Altibacter sp. HG106]MDC7995067.1 EI24 domain-containing protein [Altibacter sp. HG106]